MRNKRHYSLIIGDAVINCVRKEGERMHSTPSDIEVLIHCHAKPEPHPRRNAPAVVEAVERFLRDGIIHPTGLGGEDASTFTTTEKGRAWLRMICDTPYPVETWMDPREEAKG